MHTERRRGRPQSRILYWFRTPPGVRVGRSALDEEAIRLIEENNPDVEFDWTRILKKPSPEAPARPVERRERFDRAGRRRDDRRGTRPAERDESFALPPAPSAPVGEPLPEIAEEVTLEDSPGVEDSAPIEALPEDAGLAEPPVFGEATELAPEPPAAERLTAAQARLGSEGVLRLRARYAEVLARISERVPDPERAAELKAQAERLNPDTWVTADEVARGVEQYETVFESLRAVVGRRRKRRRRRRGATADGTPAQGMGTAAPGDEASAADEPDTEPDTENGGSEDL